MTPARFEAYSLEHLTVIALTAILPVLLAGMVRLSAAPRMTLRITASAIALLLLINYCSYLLLIRHVADLYWAEILPMQMCDWATVVVAVSLLTLNTRWFEVAYFWGIGGTLQAVLTPNLRYGFPDFRFISFFVAHCGIIIGVVFLMIAARMRPYPMSAVRAFLWSELYFVIALSIDLATGVNYGFLLRKPEAFSLLSLLSDHWPVYLLQMHLLAIVFFALLYMPFALHDLLLGRRAFAPRESVV